MKMPAASAIEEHEALRRKTRLLEITEGGLPPFQHTALELLQILNDPTANFKKAAKPIYMDPTLSAQVLRVCNSPLFGRRSRVISIEQAVTLLGSDRLRSIATTTTLVGFVGQGLPQEKIEGFWKHSFFCGMLTKNLARASGYTEVEQAYIAGLLHDIGQVPQWMLIAEIKDSERDEPAHIWLDNPDLEKRFLGVTHCELGRRMATEWGLMPSFIDVILNHHAPDEAQHDPYLVDLVSRVERFLLAKKLALESGDADPHADDVPVMENSGGTLQELTERNEATSEPTLQVEYNHLLPLIDSSLASMIGLAG